MTTKLQALPDDFFKQALKPLVKQIKLPFFLKRRFATAAIRLHQENASHKERVRQLAQLLGDQPLVWEAGSAQLRSEQKAVGTLMLLQLFVENSSFNTYRYSRRQLLIEQLKADKSCKIRVDVSVAFNSKVAPCGMCQGQVLENTKSTLKVMPPCNELRCACDWEIVEAE